MGHRGYPAEFRRKVLDLVAAGRPVAQNVAELGISDQTIYTWARQDCIDRGLEPGLSTGEKTELARPGGGSTSSRASSRPLSEPWS